MEENKEKKDIIMFPYMSQGHIIPFLALAQQLSKKGYQTRIINTPSNIKNLKQTLSPNTCIKLQQLPFNTSNHNLQPHTENTYNTPSTLDLPLLEASLSLKPAFHNLISSLVSNDDCPLAIVTDIFFGWTADVAHEFGIFNAIFCGTSGYGMACYYSILMNLPHQATENVEFALSDFAEAGTIHTTQLSSIVLHANGTDPFSMIMHRLLSFYKVSDGLLFNTLQEIDCLGLHYLRRKFDLPVWSIGPVVLSAESRARNDACGSSGISCVRWLDSKPAYSVLYISFGSHNTISATQMMQLGKALDEMTINFIWVVRPPLGFDLNMEFDAEEWLPEGFVKRMEEQERGLIVVKWARQMEILLHSATGAFLSHCGWNSVLESLCGGVPIIGWPMEAEQFYNVKYLEEELGVCVELARGTSFEVRCEDFVNKIGVVMMGENGKGKEMRERAMEVKRMIENGWRDEEGYKGSSTIGMEEFLSAAASFGKEKF